MAEPAGTMGNIHAIPEMRLAGKGEKRQLLPCKVSRETADLILSKIRAAKRPVINRKRYPHRRSP